MGLLILTVFIALQNSRSKPLQVSSLYHDKTAECAVSLRAQWIIIRVRMGVLLWQSENTHRLDEYFMLIHKGKGQQNKAQQNGLHIDGLAQNCINFSAL